MFKLEQAIEGWRKQMLTAGIESPGVMDELEAHLREEIERQVGDGAEAQAAFEISSKQIGSAKVLKTEFEKTSSFRKGFERWAARLVMGGSAAALCCVLAMWTSVLLSREMSPLYRLAGLGAVMTSVTAIFGGAFFKRFFPVLSERRLRKQVQFACLLPAVIWFLVFSKVILPNLDYEHFDVAKIFVMVLWTVTLLPVSFRLWKGFDDAVLRQPLITG